MRSMWLVAGSVWRVASSWWLRATSYKPQANKKAQFYIFVAVLLSAFALVITQTQIRPIKPVDTFKMVYGNFENEAAGVVNSAVYNQQNVSLQLADFSRSFIDYAKSRDPNFRFLYLLRYDNKISAANYLGLQVNVSTNTSSILLNDGENRIVDDSSEFNVALGNYNYNLVFGSGDAQLRAIFRSSSAGGVRIAIS